MPVFEECHVTFGDSFDRVRLCSVPGVSTVGTLWLFDALSLTGLQHKLEHFRPRDSTIT
jgi:hypothetical protein